MLGSRAARDIEPQRADIHLLDGRSAALQRAPLMSCTGTRAPTHCRAAWILPTRGCLNAIRLSISGRPDWPMPVSVPHFLIDKPFCFFAISQVVMNDASLFH
jgi:hypothetical protein